MMLNVLLGLVIAGLIFSLIRLIKGKSIESRVVAIDVMTTITSGLIVIYAYMSNNSLFLDVALIYSILSFGAVIVTARYLERGI